MSKFRHTVFDIEADGLLNTVTKIHCLSFQIWESRTLISNGTIYEYDKIKSFLNHQEYLVGHNIIRYDIPTLEKILKCQFSTKLIDTLGISYYLYPISKFLHGLASWGERLGFPKPVILENEWLGPLPGETQEQFIAKMTNRCEGDVEINTRLFHLQMNSLATLYDSLEQILRTIMYLNFKLDCLREQEEVGIKLDVRLVEKSFYDLEFDIEEKVDSLAKYMPRVVDKTSPKNMYKKDGTLSTYGTNWIELLKELDLPEDSTEITIKGNPGSSAQLKDWLFSLGWKPETFKVSKNTGKELPQVNLPFGAGLCPSVVRMFKSYPYLEELDGLYKAKHRYGIMKSYLENKDENDIVYATAHGFTNTLRMQHSKPIVNLPGVDKYYGKECRGALTVFDDSYEMCGSDISGLEDNTKQHYIYFHDPEYVNQMRVPGFDPHIDVGVLSGMITKEEEEFYKWYSAKK